MVCADNEPQTRRSSRVLGLAGVEVSRNALWGGTRGLPAPLLLETGSGHAVLCRPGVAVLAGR